MPEKRLEAGRKADLALEIAHLLFIDVVGYSKLLVNEQIELVQQLNRIVRGTQCFRDAEASERMIRLPTGDGMVLIFFRSPEQPVRCALEISEALRDWPQIQVRMGIHSGPVNQVPDVNDQLNVAGAGINIGQRVMDCGDAGHILLSKHIAEDLAQYRHWQPHLHDLGECEVKHGLRLQVFNLCKEGLGNPATPTKFKSGRMWFGFGQLRAVPIAWVIATVALAAVVLITGFWIFLHHKPKNYEATVPSIAVLPFENRSSEKENEYLTDGIQDEILTRLSKISLLKVISRTSTRGYKATPENLPQIARDLRVTHVLEGGVQKSGDTIRVTVQLIDATTDAHVWAESYDRKLTDIFSVESDIARAIAEQLRVTLTGDEEQRIKAPATDNAMAYDEYLRGLAFTLKAGTTPASTLGAQKHLREAVRLDPKFALAWALLANVDAISLFTFNFQPTAGLIEETRAASQMAFSLEPNLGEALLAKGYYNFACLRDYDTAADFFERARRLLPSNSRVPEALAYVTRRKGLWDQSDFYFEEAERLDPRNPNLLTQHALSFIHLRHFPDALKKLDQVLAITPADVDIMALKGAIAQAEGDLALAASLLNPLQPAPGHSNALETLAYQALLERRPETMIARLKEALQKPDPALGYINGELRFWLGWLQAAAGDAQAARASWEDARRELHTFLQGQGDNLTVLSDLALTNMSLGETTEAMAFANRAAEVRPVQKDAVSGPISIELIARISSRMGDMKPAVDALEQLLALPYDGALGLSVPLTPALLRLDPMFDSLRSDPRFQKLAQVDRLH